MPSEESLLNDEKRWASNDVILAAELGKALLERNRALQDALDKSQADNREKDLELELVKQQLSDLRDLMQKKSVLLEEADLHMMELDRVNHRIVQELNAERRKVKRLSTQLLHLERHYLGIGRERASANTRLTTTWSQPRPWSAGFTDTLFLSQSGSTSPLSGFRRHASRDVFIDDELFDQPALSSVQLYRAGCGELTVEPGSSCTIRTRSFSWPSINANLSSEHQIPLSPKTIQNVQPSINQYQVSTPEPSSLHGPPNLDDLSIISNSEDLKSLRDLMDEALLLKRLEAVYRIKLRSQVPNDYQPGYKQLFQEAFQLIHTLKAVPSSP